MKRAREWLGRVLRVRALRRGAAGFGVLVALGCAALLVLVAREPLPSALSDARPTLSLALTDRHGQPLRELRAGDGKRRQRVALDELSPDVVPALLSAEDQRFFLHPGVDPLAMLRAAGQAVVSGRVVSGASTLTQQLARALVPRPRSFAGKLRELVVALRLEASLDKRTILEEYLNRVEFGPNLSGIEAASRYYFDKPARELDLAEVTALIALVRGPSYYDPRRHPERLRARRDRLLSRLRERGVVSAERVELALETELHVQRAAPLAGAEHLAFALARGELEPDLARQPLARVQTTIDRELEREVRVLAQRAASELAAVGAGGVAVLVVDNATAEVLAYVGSSDYFDREALGSNDGTRALRQPGSALKPFVYAAGMERLGWSPATLLSDRALELSTPHGVYVPRNYDGREHGPVRLRLALANSLNLPAVRAAAQVGPAHVLGVLRRFGFESLERSPEHYGPAIALGAGEVRLHELAQAYSALARDGELRKLRYVRAAELASGARVEPPATPGRRALEPRLARQLTHVLADESARTQAFGAQSPLEFPFPVAAKTGTSKGFRDNWAVGYTRERTVAVWAGNFDGRPMAGSSGVSGAGPLFHAVMLAAMRGIDRAPLVRTDGLGAVEVCALSGALPGPACRERATEHVVSERAPRASCGHHELVAIDPSNGLRAGPACRDARLVAFERYPEAERAWAIAARRPLAPEQSSPRCPVTPSPAPGHDGELRIAWPGDGARFVAARGDDPHDLVVEVSGRPALGPIRLLLDGNEVAQGRAPLRARVVLPPGEHALLAVGATRTSERVRIRVDTR